MQAIEKHIKEKSLEYLRIIRTFQDDLSNLNVENSKDAAAIKALKESKPETTYKDVKGHLVSVQVRSWEMYTKDLDMTRFIQPLIEFISLAELFKIDLELSEEDIKFYTLIKNSYGSLFIAKDGKVVCVLDDQFQTLRKSAEESAKADSNLEMTFDSVIKMPNGI